MPKKKSIDAIDIKIINLLSKEARLSNKELSEKIGLAPMPTLNRVKKLRENGYLQEATTMVDLRKFGYKLIAYQVFEIKKGFSTQFRAIVANMKNVTKLQRLNSLGFDKSDNLKYGLTIHTQNTDHLIQIMNDNFKLKYIEHIDTMIIGEEHLNKNSIELNPETDTID